MKEPLHVGFDMDGVLLYNPLRILRPIVVFIKRYLLKRKTNRFYYPKNKFERFLWILAHKSSIVKADGLEDIYNLIRKKKIKAYIITSRYTILKKDCEYWFRILNKDNLFTACYYNEGDEQPYLYKEKMIKKLQLQYFVEDNWDIVNHINKTVPKDQRTKVLWIYNFIDRSIPYLHKFPTLKKAVAFLQKELA